MKTIQSQDHDNDGLIDSEGWPDQTYDAWYTFFRAKYHSNKFIFKAVISGL